MQCFTGRQAHFQLQTAYPWRAGPPGAALLGDMFGIFNSGGISRSGLLQASPPQDLARSATSLPQRQSQHQTSHPAFLRAGSGSLTNLQALREASQRPWNPSTIVSGGTVTTGRPSLTIACPVLACLLLANSMCMHRLDARVSSSEDKIKDSGFIKWRAIPDPRSS